MKADRTIALYAGSFDPITLGHLDIISKAMATFDHVHIGIGKNPRKTRLFSVEESLDLIQRTVMNQTEYDFSIGQFIDMTITDYAEQIGATHIVRGLRQASDFNDEFVIRGVIENLNPSIVVTHFICDHRFLHVSSSTARELASVNASLDWLVPVAVEDALRNKFRG